MIFIWIDEYINKWMSELFNKWRTEVFFCSQTFIVCLLFHTVTGSALRCFSCQPRSIFEPCRESLVKCSTEDNCIAFQRYLCEYLPAFNSRSFPWHSNLKHVNHISLCTGTYTDCWMFITDCWMFIISLVYMGPLTKRCASTAECQRLKGDFTYSVQCCQKDFCN